MAGKKPPVHVQDIDGSPLCGYKPKEGERLVFADLEYADKVNCQGCREAWAKVPKEIVPDRPNPKFKPPSEEEDE